MSYCDREIPNSVNAYLNTLPDACSEEFTWRMREAIAGALSLAHAKGKQGAIEEIRIEIENVIQRMKDI